MTVLLRRRGVESDKRVVSGGGPAESLFSTYPASGYNDGEGDFTLGTIVRFTVPGVVTHIRFPMHGSFNGTAWNMLVGLAASGDYNNDTDYLESDIPADYQASFVSGLSDAGAWKTIALPVPRPVVTTDYYMACWGTRHNGTTAPRSYYADTNYFASGDVTGAGGHVIGVRNEFTASLFDNHGGNGRFSYGAEWPIGTFQAGSYYIDPIFQPT